MSIREIEATIAQLPKKDLSKVTEWLIDYQAKSWDEEIEKDLEDGSLDKILDEVHKEYDIGLATFDIL
jgi:methionine salvage enolase-phosphatase E1